MRDINLFLMHIIKFGELATIIVLAILITWKSLRIINLFEQYQILQSWTKNKRCNYVNNVRTTSSLA